MCTGKPKAPPTPAPLPVAPPPPPTPEEVATSVKTADSAQVEEGNGANRGLNILRIPLRTSQRSTSGALIPKG